MKFKTEKRTRMVPFTIDGTTNEVPEPYEVQVPVLPRNWKAVATKAAVVLVLTLTTIAVVWSTVSIGALLGGGVGLAAAVLFDLAWIINILLEHLARYDADKRKFPRRMGWALLGITMGAIFWHGMLLGSVALAVVGALVSMVAKLLWMGIMSHVHREVRDPKLKAWIAKEREKADAAVILADVRRDASEAEHRAALELLAAESIRRDAFGETGTDLSALLSSLPAALSAPAGQDDKASAAVSAPTDAPAEISAASRPAPGQPLFQAPGVRADEDGYPHEPASAQVSTPGNVRSIRPDVRPEPEPTPPVPAASADQEEDEERVPEQTPRRVSIAKEVRRMVADGMTDADYIVRSLGERFDRTDDRFASTVKRYVREASKTDSPTGQGLYL